MRGETDNWDRIQREAFESDRLTNFYADENNRYLLEKKLRRMMQFSGVPKECSILEIGCGCGASFPLLRDWGYKRVIGIDLSWANVRAATANGMESSVASATRLPFKDNSFDVVIGMDILHHILDIDSCLAEVRRVANDYVFCEPNIVNPFSLLFGLPKSERTRFRSLIGAFKRNQMPSLRREYCTLPPYNTLKESFGIRLNKTMIDRVDSFFDRFFPKFLRPKIIITSRP